MLGGGIESLPDGAVVVPVGEDGFVMPWPYFRPTASQAARIEVAAMVGLVGLVLGDEAATTERRRLLGEVESEMAREAKRRAKIPEGRAVRTEADTHIEDGAFALVPARSQGLPVIETPVGHVYCPDPHRARYDANRAPVMEKFNRLTYVEPESVAVRLDHLDKSDRDALKDAAELMGSRSRAKRVEGRAKGEDVQRRLLSRRDFREVNKGLVERRALDANRQEIANQEHLAACRRHWEAMDIKPAAIEALLERTRAELEGEADPTQRAGLDQLMNSGAIDAAERAAGEKYGQVFEKARSKLKVANLEGAGGAGAISDEVERNHRLRDLANKQALTEIEAYVQAHVKSPRALTVLRLVAGEGRCVSHFSKGASRAKNVEALQLALEALATKWGLK